MPSLKTLLVWALLLAALLPGRVAAQETMQVETAAELRGVLSQAESLLAAGNAQRAPRRKLLAQDQHIFWLINANKKPH